MKRLIPTIVATLAITTLACGNNRNTGDNQLTSRANDRSDRDRSAESRATLTGCLLAGGDAGSYVLQVASTSASGVPPASTSSGTASSQAYRLIARNGEDLSANLNKRVAVNGQIEGAAVGTSGATGLPRANGANDPTGSRAESGAANGGNTAGSTESMQTIHADSVQKVADQCSTPTDRNATGK